MISQQLQLALLTSVKSVAAMVQFYVSETFYALPIHNTMLWAVVVGSGRSRCLRKARRVDDSCMRTGDLSESRDNSSDSDGSDSDDGSETESEFDDRLAQKKQKTDNS